MDGREAELTLLELETASLGRVELNEKAGAGVSTGENLKKEQNGSYLYITSHIPNPKFCKTSQYLSFRFNLIVGGDAVENP